MASLLGRDTELARIGAVLETVRASHVAHAVRIAGAAGVGKTAVLARAEGPARERGWLVARIDVHRIQESLPLVAGRRLTDRLIEALGDDAPRYAGALPLTGPQRDEDPASFREAVVRFVEGVLHDHSLLIAIDDAQWIDPESRALIEELLHSFADRAVALLASERTGERPAFGAIAETLALGPVPQDAAAALVQEHYPDAPPPVVEGILQHAKGVPLDIVALAQSAYELRVRDADGVHASIRAAVAGQLQFVDKPLREFLQICSLIAEPLDYTTLVRLWPEEQLSAHMEAASGKYLVQDGSSLRFVHSAIAESIRQTMPVEIPFRRRIIAALTALESPSLEEHERIVQQAVACGDSSLAHKHLLLLAKQATRESALFTASNAYERAFEIAAPNPSELVDVYLEYASVLNMQGRLGETGTILQRALADTTAYGISEKAGALAALYLIAQWGTKGYEAALEASEPLLRRFKSGADRQQLLSVVAWLHACGDDAQRFESTKATLAENGELPHELRMRLYIAEGCLAVHRGEVDRARRAAENAVAEAGSIVTPNRRSAEVTRCMVNFLSGGPRDMEALLPQLRFQHASDRTQIPVIEYLRALIAISRGEITEARELTREALSRPGDRLSRIRLLGIESVLAALTATPSMHAAEIGDVLAGYSGAPSDLIAVSAAVWQAVALAAVDAPEARSLLINTVQTLGAPQEITTVPFPLGLAVCAARLRDRETLERLHTLSGIWKDRAPWNVAAWDLAAGYAGHALGKASAAAQLTRAEEAFAAMQAPFFAALARFVTDGSAAGYLAERGIRVDQLAPHTTVVNDGEARRKGSAVPSRRELEIIALVAEGQTNRHIAQQLFLSERTVEGHIASVFNKLNVSSRTQVAAWYLTQQASASIHPHAQGQTYSHTV